MARRWFSFLLILLIFTVPTNLFLSFSSGSEYVHGLRVDYLIPKLYLSDLVVIAILVSCLFFFRPAIGRVLSRAAMTPKKYLVLVFVLIAVFFARQFFTEVPLISVVAFFRLIVMVLLTLFISKLSKYLEKSWLLIAVAATVLFQSLVALFQWFTQTSVYGYALLGEPNISHPLGLAKTMWWGSEAILPYGTTAHPNVLGGFLAVYLTALLYITSNYKLKAWHQTFVLVAFVIGLGTLLLTHSVSALLALGIGIIIICAKRSLSYVKAWQFFGIFAVGTIITGILLALSVVTFQSTDISTVRRFYLFLAGTVIFVQHAVLGIGLSQFTLFLDQALSNEKAIVPFLQPVHNTLVLLMAEVGILGLAAIVGVKKLLQSLNLARRSDQTLGWFAPIIPVLFFIFLPLAMVDHYLFTVQTGLLLVAIAPLLFVKK